MVSRERKVKTVKQHTFTEPLTAPEDEVMRDPEIKVSRVAYPLDEADYLILTRKVPSGIMVFIAGSCFGVAAAYAIEIIAKQVEALAENTIPEIESWKKWALGISLICSIVCFLVGLFLPSQKKKLLKRIKQRLESQPKTVESHKKYRTGYRRY